MDPAAVLHQPQQQHTLHKTIGQLDKCPKACQAEHQVTSSAQIPSAAQPTQESAASEGWVSQTELDRAVPGRSVAYPERHGLGREDQHVRNGFVRRAVQCSMGMPVR